MKQLEKGQRFYYTGDAANQSGFGVIDGIKDDNYHIKFDDGRPWAWVANYVWDKSPGQRFMTIEQYNEERSERDVKMQEFIHKYSVIKPRAGS